MIRLLHVHFASRTVLLLVSEFLLVCVALVAALTVRIGMDESGSRFADSPELSKLLVPCALCIVIMYYYDLYDSAVLRSTRESLPRLLQALGTVCVVIMLVYYAYPLVQVGRVAFVLWIVLAGGSLILWRYLFCALNRSSRLSQRTILVGTSALAQAVRQEIALRPELGIDLLGFVSRDNTSPLKGTLENLGQTEQLAAIVGARNVSRLIVTMDDRRGNLPVEELLEIKSRGVAVQDGAEAYEAITGRIHLESLRPSWLLFSDGFILSKQMLIYKRLASIVTCGVALLVSLPVMAVVALAIRIDSAGPVLFRQRRVGRDGKLFTLVKFRTMYHNPREPDSDKSADKNDRRVTRVGKVLRRIRLDELPQLYNIARGDMYFIGPRPFTPTLEKAFAKAIPFYEHRWRVKPGLTGWAQVQRGYCSSLEDNADKLSCDLYYIKNLSIGFDCLILFQTIKILLLGRGAR